MEYYVVDAFTDVLFCGNPAGVCVVDRWPTDRQMQQIAAENNLAETAFIMADGDGYAIRWFTPEWEMDLCGHATLAGAFVVLNFLCAGSDQVVFSSPSGPLAIRRQGALYSMDFPARPPAPVPVTQLMLDAVGAPILEAYKSRDYMFLLESEQQIRQLAPKLELAAKIPGCVDFMVTAPGTEVDFVSRFFTPGASISEDPVTGSAHCTLIPFWAGKLGKNKLVARQLSSRGGTLYCENLGSRVIIAGNATLYLSGQLHFKL